MNRGFISYYSKELGLSLERAIADRSLPLVDKVSTLEDRVSLVLGAQNQGVWCGLVEQRCHQLFHTWQGYSGVI